MITQLFTGAAGFLESEAGHNLISAALIAAGAVMLANPSASMQTAAHDLIAFGLGVLARSMGTTSPTGKA